MITREHYTRLKPQTIERMQAVMSPEEFIGFCRGNVIKYAERAGHKDKTQREVAKLIDYAHWWLEALEGKKISWNITEENA